MSAAVKEGLPSYTPEEEKLIIRNKAGVPIGVKPHNKWTVRKVIVWVVITALGVLGWTMLAIVRGEEVNTIWFVVTAVCTYAIAYRFYGLYIQRKIMRPDDTNATPAERINNGKDFDPTNRVVLYGHHFAAIAGAGPLVGPVLAAQMGYLPGTLWIILGVCVAGAVQDMLVLFFSMRRGGRSLGQMATDEIGRIGGTVATIAVLVMLMIVLAVLAMVCVNALAASPWGVFSVGCTIPIAVGMGLWLRYISAGKITQVSIVGCALLIGVIIAGRWVSTSAFGKYLHLSPTALVWAMIVYGFFAAVLPVWVLLTPRDYLSTFMKVGTIVVLALGIIIVRPIVEMPAVTEFASNTAGPVFAGKLFPFLFITIACGALSGMHAMVSSGTTPKMIQKESQTRMIGYGGMLMESFVAIMALAAAVSLNQGVYFGMNTSEATVDKLAGPAVVQAADGNREQITAEAVGNLGVTDAHGNKIQATWDSWDENGNDKVYYGADALKQVANDAGEPSVVSRTGGAPTLATGMAHILHQIGGGKTMMGFWYHFAIMFEALFILSAVDAVTRVARFQVSDALGNAFKKFKDPSWRVGAWSSTALVVAAWGSLLLMGVTDPRGGIQTLYPLFGIANQLIAAVALLLCTVMVIRKGYKKYVWIPLVPFLFDAAVTFTASWEKIFSTDPLVGYWQQWRNARQLLTTLTDPAKIEIQKAIIRNTFIQGTLSIAFLAAVVFVLICAIIRVVKVLRTGDTTTSEDPHQESNFFAPGGLFASKLDKKLVAEYHEVGDPALIPGLKKTERIAEEKARHEH
ncbi:Carbon starvation protein [Propionibacterium freudenreichii]|uniref:carbon starvation CstA family protein n=1 Tax=Propionibacterium freudenreichii TaxID=1744 RepID=UPI000BC32D50|nr:carbon starvation CstA family protein [Propionibacterium freudenreichii]SBT28775.1 Carbon starvation protein [Propionibacterium freudenreichii]